MTELEQKLKKTVREIRKVVKGPLPIGIILGTGLGAFAKNLSARKVLSYERIPHFPKTTALSHAGRLIAGTIGGRGILALEGRFHYYEGYSLKEVTYPVRVLKALGCRILIVSNASGGLNPSFHEGDLMLIEDQMNLMGVNPLIGPNEDRLGDRFPDMSQPYDRKLIALAERVASRLGLPVQKGVYLGVTGPNLETRAEYRFFQRIGADCVGMSTVPEVIVARHARMRVLGISCITDMCLPETLKVADINRIIRVAKESEPKLTRLVVSIIRNL